MKKVIFISALAIAAAVSCTKSDIVDTKFNEAISFENYIGRDAMTKAGVTNSGNIADFGLYGFYTGATPWNTSSPSNLWTNAQVKKVDNWAPTDKKYWTNEKDLYTFLAYSPFASATNGITVKAVDESGRVADPTITYVVDKDLTKQVDLLYANTPAKDGVGGHIDMVKPADKGPVALVFKHALSRITVKAAENHPDYTYTIEAIQLKGAFTKSSTFNIKGGSWGAAASTETEAYSFVLPEGGVAVETTNLVECIKSNEYLMVIPVSVTNADLTITYRTTYDGIVSAPITKTVNVTEEFVIGKAYSLNLTFGPNEDDLIKFTVSVDEWEDEAGTDKAETEVLPTPPNPEQGA